MTTASISMMVSQALCTITSSISRRTSTSLERRIPWVCRWRMRRNYAWTPKVYANLGLELVTVEAATEKYVWANKPRNTMKLVRHEIESEDESRLFWGGNGATQYRIVNKDHRNYFGNNNYGEYRGYRVLPSQGTCHLAATDSTNLLNAANFAYHDLQVSRKRDVLRDHCDRT